MEPIALRLATAADLAALELLAQLDSRPLPPGPHLVAEREGKMDAALSLATGEAIADPFRPTAGLVELLGLLAARLRTGREREPTRLRARARLVPA